jgi:MFS family permease
MVLLSVASGISMFGTAIYNFAIGLYVLKMTGSGLSFAGTMVLAIISAILVNPFAGVFADKLNKKFLAVFTDIINGVLLLGLFLLSLKCSLNLFNIYMITLLLNIFSTIYGISMEAAKPNLVSEEKLMSINSISKIIESSSSILGPAIGGIVFAIMDIKIFILVNGLSFLLSAILQLLMDFKYNYRNNVTEKEGIHFLKDFSEGFQYLIKQKEMFKITGMYIALNFFIGFSINIPLPYIVNNVMNLNANFYGLIQAAFPIGMILGALIIKRIMEKYEFETIIRRSNNLLSAAMAAIGIAVILFYQFQNAVFYLIYFHLFMFLAGIAIASLDIPIFYILQQTIPDEFRGRVLSIGISLVKIILPVSLILSGVLINHIPSYILPLAGGIGLFLFNLIYLKGKQNII